MKEMSETVKSALEATNASAVWIGTCRVCGAKLKGTLAELAAHTHDPDTKPGPSA